MSGNLHVRVGYDAHLGKNICGVRGVGGRCSVKKHADQGIGLRFWLPTQVKLYHDFGGSVEFERLFDILWIWRRCRNIHSSVYPGEWWTMRTFKIGCLLAHSADQCGCLTVIGTDFHVDQDRPRAFV